MNLKKRVLFLSLIVAAISEILFTIDCLSDFTFLTGAYFDWAIQFYHTNDHFTYVIWYLPAIPALWPIIARSLDTDDGLFIAPIIYAIAFGFIVFLPLIISVIVIIDILYVPLYLLFDKRTVRLLKDDKQYDLIFLSNKGYVRAHGKGQSITKIYGEINNLLNKKLSVAIEAGTYFVARGNYQNMATKEKYTFTLMPNDSRLVSINAACINANRPIPGEKDHFDGVKKVSPKLAKFLFASKNCNEMTVQAGVWAITDNFSGSQIINRLFIQDRYGNRQKAVSEKDVSEARKILNELGIKNRL